MKIFLNVYETRSTYGMHIVADAVSNLSIRLVRNFVFWMLIRFSHSTNLPPLCWLARRPSLGDGAGLRGRKAIDAHPLRPLGSRW
eukprot:1559043-Pleurochrysis_carterae.AAC.1